MRLVYVAIAAILGFVFLRADIKLLDLFVNANLRWSLAILIFLVGILVGQFFVGYRAEPRTFRWAGWGLFAAAVLGVLEYSIEWQNKTLIANNQQIHLSADSLETVEQHFVQSKGGLFVTETMFNNTKTTALIDTGASLVLLNFETAKAAGIDVSALTYSTPVTTASGPLNIAEITLESVKIGNGIIARNVKAAVTPKGSKHSNLLGASFLMQLDEAIISNDRIVLRKRR